MSDASDAHDDHVVDRALASWRQGDSVIGDQPFVHRFNPSLPVTKAAISLLGTEEYLLEDDALGLVVLTQTCDIIRKCVDRPFVQVALAVRVSAEELNRSKRRRSPRLAFVPGLAHLHLVADLDCVMTVEKGVVAAWPRTIGCRNTFEIQQFSDAVARKLGRFAFPNDFEEFVKPLTKRVRDKAGRASDEGRALDELLEIRVTASPSWEAATIDLMFWFLRDADGDSVVPEEAWNKYLNDWLARIPASRRFAKVDGVVFKRSGMNADEYVHSDRLDLDYLSSSDRAAADEMKQQSSDLKMAANAMTGPIESVESIESLLGGASKHGGEDKAR